MVVLRQYNIQKSICQENILIEFNCQDIIMKSYLHNFFHIRKLVRNFFLQQS